MHATDSLDFLIVHKGQVTLHLDSGEKTMINEGEVIGKYTLFDRDRLRAYEQYKGARFMPGRMKRMNGLGCL
jgi:hypothetical protein